MTAFAWLVIALYVAALLVLLVTIAREDLEYHQALLLAAEADDWDEPSRAEVEAALNDTPIYAATCEHIARHAAADLDDEWRAICDATGGDA